VFTQAEVEGISGKEGAYEVDVKLTPRLVNDNCTACGKCAEACPVERPNDFNYGMDKTKAIYLPHRMAFPMMYVADAQACTGADCTKCVEACEYDAIDLKMPEKKLKLKVGSVVAATGWQPYDANKLDNLGFGTCENVITNVMMERLAAPDGPTKGKIVRPSDGKEVSNIAFVQCAGSRDENHLPYCSGVCCLGSLKQSTYVKEQYPEAKISMFYIDVRALGILEDFYQRVQGSEGLSLVRGKVAKIEEEPGTKDLTLHAEDTMAGEKVKETVEMVVLATGMVPSTAEAKITAEIAYDNYGFVASEAAGVYAAGCIRRPADVSTSVQDATRAALKAIQSVVRGGANG
jgi:quinone-modifying oxidoreductase subunit QmoA